MQISLVHSSDLGKVKTVDIQSIVDIGPISLEKHYSLSTFSNRRIKADFRSARFVGLDFDQNYSLTTALEDFKKFRCIIGTTRNHQKEKNGLVCDRFRVILELESDILDNNFFDFVVRKLHKRYPAADASCKDSSRFFYPFQEVVYSNPDGMPLSLSKVREEFESKPVVQDKKETLTFVGDKGRLSFETKNLLKNGIEPGGRNHSVFKIAKDFQQNGYSIEETNEVILTKLKANGTIDFDFPEQEVKNAIASAYTTDSKHPPRTTFQLFKLDDIYKETPRIEWVVDRLLHKGGLSLISGMPKAGKSTFVRQLIRDIYVEGSFLGRKTIQGEVHYYAFEEQAEIISQSFKKMGLPSHHPVYVHSGSVHHPEYLKDFYKILNERKPIIAVLDTLFDFLNVESENNYSQVKKELSRVKNIAKLTGTHIICLHHTSKSMFATGQNAILGSTAIAGGMDSILMLSVDDGKRYIETQGRSIKNWKGHELIWNQETDMFTLGEVKSNDNF